jgi:hypothetical protein
VRHPFIPVDIIDGDVADMDMADGVIMVVVVEEDNLEIIEMVMKIICKLQKRDI